MAGIEGGGGFSGYTGPPILNMDPPPVYTRTVPSAPPVNTNAANVVASPILQRSWVALPPPPLPATFLVVGTAVGVAVPGR